MKSVDLNLNNVDLYAWFSKKCPDLSLKNVDLYLIRIFCENVDHKNMWIFPLNFLKSVDLNLKNYNFLGNILKNGDLFVWLSGKMWTFTRDFLKSKDLN